MGIQTITTPAGEEMVVMPRAEYEALLDEAADAYEDGADAATFAAALAAQRPEDVLPAAVSAAILAGHGRPRAFREWRGISTSALSEQTGIAKSVLDEIEAGKRLLDREAAARIGVALDLPAGWLAA